MHEHFVEPHFCLKLKKRRKKIQKKSIMYGGRHALDC
jgi:hypothetical protein